MPSGSRVTLKMTPKKDVMRDINRLKRRLTALKNTEGHAGFFSDRLYPSVGEGKDREGQPVAAIAFSNNYGVTIIGTVSIPERPFFTLAVSKMFTSFDKDIASVVRSALIGDKQTNRVFKNYLTKFQEAVQLEILEMDYPRNTLKTVRLKGFNDPLIDTGFMYDSVSIRIRPKR